MKWPADYKNYKIVDGDFLDSSKFIETLRDFNGIWTSNEEHVVLEVEGEFIKVEYYIGISGHTVVEPRKWDYPGHIETEIDPIEWEIRNVCYAESEISINIDPIVQEHLKQVILKLI